MIKGIVLGLLFQVVAAIGFTFIERVATLKDDLYKTMLALCITGVVALGVVLYYQFSGRSQLFLLTASDVSLLVVGSVMVFVLGEFLYISGLSAANLTTMAYTALAYPAVALILDIVLKRISFSLLTFRDFLGMTLLVAGFILLLSKSAPN